MKSPPKNSASKRAPAKISTPKSQDPLRALVSRVSGPNLPLVALLTRGLTRAALNELGQSFASETILKEVPSFVETQLLAWKALGPEDRARFVGWSEPLVAQIVHESVKLADMLASFDAASRAEAGEKKGSESRYKSVRSAAIAQRDHAARVLRPLLPVGSDAADKLSAAKFSADSPELLAKGIVDVASVAKALVASANAAERAALDEMRVNETLVASLESLAADVRQAGELRTKGAPATRVGQEQLDEQDGVVLRLIQVAWRAWREGRKVVPSIPLPNLGALRGLVRTGSSGGDDSEEPSAPTT